MSFTTSSQTTIRLFPSTPSGKSHEELNLLVRNLNTQWDLGLPVRDEKWSPSIGTQLPQNKCFEDIKFLYFSSRPELTTLLDSFSASLKRYPNVDRLTLLQERLRELVGSTRKQKVEQQRAAKHRVSIFQERRAWKRDETPEATDDDDDEFATPPQSPTRDAVLRHTRNASADTSNSGWSSTKKRHSDNKFEDCHSPKVARTSSGHRSSTSISVYHTAAPPSPVIPVDTNLQPTQSTILSATNSFASTILGLSLDRSTARKGNQSFDTVITEPDSRDEGSSTNYGSIPSLDGHIDSNLFHDHPNQKEPVGIPYSSGQVSWGSDLNEGVLQVAKSFDAPPITPLSEVDQHMPSSSQVTEPTSAKPAMSFLKPHRPEHHRVRDLVREELFLDESKVPSFISQLPFRVRYECARVGLASEAGLYDFAKKSLANATDYDELWSHFKNFANDRHLKLPSRMSPRCWDAATGQCHQVNLKARLLFNMDTGGPLFKIKLDRMELDKPCRFQYVFGGDRFLYLLTPDFNKLPEALKGQDVQFRDRFLEWMKGEKRLLGRSWEVVHFEQHKAPTKAARKERRFGYRLILFATKGYDIQPKVGSLHTKPNLLSSMPEVTIKELVNWFMPLRTNDKLTFCKAYSRLDLGFSRTSRTFGFNPSEIRWVKDMYGSNKIPESTEFNDIELDFTLPKDMEPQSMNDGCARISVGACREIWKILGHAGPIPSAFQARINGAKGVWIRSGPVDSQSPEHNQIWIEINESQRKFLPHPEDMPMDFDPARWTFEVNKYTKKAKASTLNIAFIPILQDRGVHHDDIQYLMTGVLDRERSDIIDAVDDPIKTRYWVHKNVSFSGDQGRYTDLQWDAGLPFANADKITHLLESGFTPTRLQFLGDATERVVRKKFTQVVQSFSIPLAKSTMLIGVADPTGKLQPGEIHLAFSNSFNDEVTDEAYPFLDKMEVLVARHPSMRRSDIQKVRARYVPELSHLVDVVVFPSTGSIPLASKLQGGDYDGDTFWICFEPALVKDFRNAPAPLPSQLPTPTQLGIVVDKRRLRDVLVGSNPVQNFLRESWEFRYQMELLGQCTNLHAKVAYHDNSLDSSRVTALVNLHDHLIDFAKSGYKYTEEAYRDFLRSANVLDKKGLPQPAYIEAMETGFDDMSGARRGTPASKERGHNSKKMHKQKLEHILDFLFFKVIDPHIRHTFTLLRGVLDREKNTYDEDLRDPYSVERRYGLDDKRIQVELEELTKDLNEIHARWDDQHRRRSGSRPSDASPPDFDVWDKIRQECFQMYQDLKPKDEAHPVIKRWNIEQVGQGPTRWELIKATALFCKHHASYSFTWNLAGRELMYIKSHRDSSMHSMVAPFWAQMKPRKVKMGVASEKGPDTVLKPLEEDEGDFAEDVESDGDEYYSVMGSWDMDDDI